MGPVARLVASLSTLNRRRHLKGLGRVVQLSAKHLKSLRNIPIRMVDRRTLFLDLRDPVCTTYYLLGQIPTDVWETEFVRSIVQPGETAIDIGAFVGWYSTLLAEVVGPRGRVSAFEPNGAAFGLLSQAAKVYPQLKVHHAAVGERAGDALLHVPRTMHAASLRGVSDTDAVQHCRVTSLDDHLGSLGRPHPVFVKCDAEGAELNILKGARQLLANHPAVWMIEMSPETAARFGYKTDDIVEFFRGVGRAAYRGYRITYPSGRLSPLNGDPFDSIFNAVFIPRSLGCRLAAYDKCFENRAST